MICISQVSLIRGGALLLDKVDLIIHKGQKIGVTGANGGGKSSFFSLLKKEISPDSGEIDIPPNLVIAHVEQEVSLMDAEAVEYVIDGDAELREIQRRIASQDGEKMALSYSRFEEIDGYGARSRAAKLMSGLGFSAKEISRRVGEFSGGWRMRLNLARALMCRSDILLLDEPTNHLDMEAVLWLEEWLKSYGGTLLLISHDRDFLDGTVGHICHLENKCLKLYTGNYADFESQRSANLAQQQSAFEKQQRQAAHLQSYIDRFRAKATKARQAQSRIKALEKMEIIAMAHVDSPFSFEFRDPLPCSNPLLQLDRASAGYGERKIIEKVTLSIEKGARIGLIGANGAGKSTLIKLIAGVLSPLEGIKREGIGLKIGYFAQHQIENLDLCASPLDHLKKMDKRTREQDFRNFLGSFDFRGDAVISPIMHFSGGEKARLALSLLIWERPNLLLLDEPTNHLDLDMRHALTRALQNFSGAMILVSHDRHLLKTTADQLILAEEGKVSLFDGDLDDYRQKLKAKEVVREKKAQIPRNARRFLESSLKKIERELEILGGKKVEMEEKLLLPEVYSDREKSAECLLLCEQMTKKQEELEMQWIALSEELDG